MASLFAALAGLVLSLPPAALPPVDTTFIVLVATTDVHSRATAWDYERDLEAPYGLVRAATVVDSLRRAYPGRVVLVDVGDLLHGTPFATYFARIAPQDPHPVIDLMSRMGYDAATPGNHEFNFGPDFFERSLRAARFPYVSANIVRDPTGLPVLLPSTFVTRAGVRIGITGVTTPGVMIWDSATVRGRIRVLGVAESGPPVIRQLRAQGADVTVLLGHAGLRGSGYASDQGVPPENDVAALLAAAPETDVAILGHTHGVIADTTVGTTLVTQPLFWAQSVAVVHLAMVRQGRRWVVARKWSELVPLAGVRPDSALVAAMAAPHAAVRAWTQAQRSQAAAPQGDSIVLRLLTTNDLHGALLPRTQPWSNGREVGGAAAIAGMMGRLARECGCPTLRLDDGDAMQGTPISNLTYGRATVEAFNAMGYAASAIGNHEFDWTPDTLAARIRDARFPWLSANIRTTAGGRPAWVEPWRMVRAGPLKVALIGYTTVTAPTVTRPDYVAGLRFDGGAAIVDSLVAVARGDSAADVVILLAHEGAFCDERQGCRGEVVDLAQALTRKPDLIVSGHTHTLVNAVVNGIPVVQARSNGTALGVVDFVARPGGGRAARIRVETVWADREQPDTAVARVVDGFRRAVEPLTSRPVATLAEALARRGDQYALGNLIADAYRAAARSDVALVNNGGIRADLPAGAVSWGELFEVLPFQNYVTRLTVTGAVLRRAIAHAVGAAESRAHVSGVRVTVSRGAPDSSRTVNVTLPNGRPLRDDASYTLAVPDFLAGGGSGYAMLRGQPAVNTGIVDIDAFVNHLRRARQPVRAAAEPRIATAVAP